MPVQKLNLCAKCAKPLTYEQKLFFSCDKCGLAKSAIEDLAMFDEKYCGNCDKSVVYWYLVRDGFHFLNVQFF